MLDQYSQLGKEPIPGDEPAGVNYRYGEEYEQVEAEVSQLDSVSGGQVDWDLVAKNCQVVLAEKSKDIKIAAILCRALYHKHDYSGLAVGLTVLHELCEIWWDDAMPPVVKRRGRIGALGWLDAKLPSVLSRPSASLQDDWQRCVDVVGKLQSFTQERLDEALFNNLQTKLAEAESLDPASPKAAAPKSDLPLSTGTITPPTTTAAEVNGPANQGDTGSSVTHNAAGVMVPDAPEMDTSSDASLRKSLTDIAGHMVNYYPEVPLGYRIGRHLAWHQVQVLPEADAGGLTQLNPPPADRVRQYADMLAGAQYTSLICMVEMSVIRSPFWLQGSYIVWQSLQSLGHKFAADAVFEMVLAYLQRMPKLTELQFSDGTPFVPEDVKEWLNSRKSQKKLAGGAIGGASGGGDSELIKAVEKANENMGSGDLNAALDVLVEGLANAETPRERFIWELEQGKFCLRNGFLAMALTQFDRLYFQAVKLKLARWEPDLADDVADMLKTALEEQYDSVDEAPACWQPAVDLLLTEHEDWF